MKIPRQIIRCLVLLFLLSSCTAFHLRDANKMLVDLYTIKLDLDQAGYNLDEKVMLSGNLHQSFVQLALDAAKEAENPETGSLNQIAFYRIAATASWQAMNTAVNKDKIDASKKRVQKYAEEGAAKCTKANDAPRDCAMLLVIPALAGIDEYKKIHERIQEKIKSNQAEDQEVIHLFTMEKTALDDLISKFEQIAETDVHPQLLDHLRHTMKKVFCRRVDSALQMIGMQMGKGHDVYKTKEKEETDLKNKLVELGLDSNKLDCL